MVVDASVMVEVLLRAPGSERLRARLAKPGRLCAPALLDVEVAQALRRYAATGELPAQRGREAIDLLRDFPIVRYGHVPLLARVWQLRANLNAYDATYVALAAALRAPDDMGGARRPKAPPHPPCPPIGGYFKPLDAPLAAHPHHRTGADAPSRPATWSNSVDLPTPGSPPRSTRAPGAIPPPRTRSNSATPVPRPRSLRSPPPARGPASGWPSAGTAALALSSVFHSPHPGQRPNQRADM